MLSDFLWVSFCKVKFHTNTNTQTHFHTQFTGKMTGGMTIEGRIDFQLGIATSSSTNTLNSQSVVYGGDPYVAGWITKQNQPDLAKQLFSTWKSSLGSNPIVVR